MSRFETPKSNPAMVLFALGHAEASHSFLRLLPEEIASDATSVLAFRVLGSLWAQYRIDCEINRGRTLLSVDNGYELRVFTALVAALAVWPPLLTVNNVIRAHAPPVLADERPLYDSEFETKRDAATEMCDQIARLPTDLDPVKRFGLLVDRCQKFEEQYEAGIGWALNLAGANRLDLLGRSKAAPPYPALFDREMLRIDRSKAWRDDALCAALTESAHQMSAAVFESVHAVQAFRTAFPNLRRNSRLSAAHVYLAGIGTLSPALLSRLVECSEPGARKMLRQLAHAGFAHNHAPSPSFEGVRGFRLGWPGAPWLYRYSATEPTPADLFTDD